MSSSDHPQFEPQPLVSAEPPTPDAPNPFATATVAQVPTAARPAENPVWDGWDVLLIAGLTVAASLGVSRVEAAAAAG